MKDFQAQDIIDKIEAGTHVLMPVKPGGKFLEAIHGYYANTTKYRDRPESDACKADCWMALMALHAAIAVAKSGGSEDIREPTSHD